MKCFSKDYVITPTKNIINYMKSITEYSITDSDDILREKCCNFPTTRHLQLWHDAS